MRLMEFRVLVEGVGLALTDEQVAQFERFHAALYESNEVMNLTRVPAEEAWIRHYLDCLLFQDLIPFRAKVLDIGTGPGFPAWPLACARPDLKVTAVDSSGKMLGFLRSQSLPNLEIVQMRAEELNIREKFEFVTGRALAPLACQLEISSGPCAVGGMVVPMRTDAEEFSQLRFEALGIELSEVIRRPLADSGITRAFPIYKKVSKTHRGYPRRWAEIKANPLQGSS